MITYVWNADTESDAQRIANAKLPARFWKALAFLAGDNIGTASGSYELDGDTLTLERSYVIITRDGKRIATLPIKTLIRTNALAKKLKAKADADVKAKKTADCIIWEP